jgi:hypothetical protein
MIPSQQLAVGELVLSVSEAGVRFARALGVEPVRTKMSKTTTPPVPPTPPTPPRTLGLAIRAVFKKHDTDELHVDALEEGVLETGYSHKSQSLRNTIHGTLSRDPKLQSLGPRSGLWRLTD